MDGGAPVDVSCVQTGVPLTPLAFESTQTSFVGDEAPIPPKMISVLPAASKTADMFSLAAGAGPVGASCVQVGVPPTTTLAQCGAPEVESDQISFSGPAPA